MTDSLYVRLMRGDSCSVGVLIPTREAWIAGSSDAGPLVDFALAAHELGFDSVWAGDSLTARPRLEPLTLLSAVAGACPGIAVGTAALTAAIRHPVMAAHVIATLDQVAQGRLILGLGAGFPYEESEAEFVAAGVPFNERLGRLADAVKLWRALWDPDRDRSQPLNYQSRYWTFDGIENLPLPYREGGPPLWFAGAGPSGLRVTGRLFDGWLPYSPKPEDLEAGRATISDSARRVGRDLDRISSAMYVTINLSDDAAAARAEIERYALAYYGFPLEVMEQLQAFYSGDASGCIEWLRGFRGVDHFIFRMGSLDHPGRLLERTASEVLGPLKGSLATTKGATA